MLKRIQRLRAAGARAALVALIAAAPLAAQVDAPLKSGELARQYMKAHSAGDYPKAIEIGKQWASLKPKDNGAAYNLACAYALNGDADEAIEWLQKSTERGWDDPGHIMRDTDLVSLRDHPAFKAVVEKATENQKPRLERAARSKPLIIVPPSPEPWDSSRAAPLIVALHGRGGTAEGFVDEWKDVAAAAGAILALPRAVRSVSMSGFGWTGADEAEAIVNSALKQVTEQYAIDSKRIVLTGFSQGGSMSYIIAGRQPARFRGVIPVGGFYDPALATPRSMSPSGGAKYYIMVGDSDRPDVVQANRRAAADLQSTGLEVKLVVFPGLGHAFPENRSDELTKALDFVFSD